MSIYISVDIEGISGVVHGDMMMPSQPEYERGRRLMTADANAAVAGVLEAGADYILVNDSHGPMRNILIEELHPAAHLVTGAGDAKEHCMVEGADSAPFDAALFIGYHAMANTSHAIHAHTIAGKAVAELRINGVAHGETGVNAAVLSSLGIPTLLVTGDETTTQEARTFLGDAIETVAVKKACGHNAAICRPLAECRSEITAAGRNAVERAGDEARRMYIPETPWTMEVDFHTMAQCNRASRVENVERLGAVSVAIHGKDGWNQYQTLWAAIRSALYEPAPWLG